MQTLRSVEHELGLEKLYVMGTNCVDNGKREGLQKFLDTASESPDTALHYEFMQVCLDSLCPPFQREDRITAFTSNIRTGTSSTSLSSRCQQTSSPTSSPHHAAAASTTPTGWPISSCYMAVPYQVHHTLAPSLILDLSLRRTAT